MLSRQNLNHFFTSGELYSPALKPQQMAAAVRAGRPEPMPPPPPQARLYCTPPSLLVASLRYLMPSLMAAVGTAIPALRAARRPWSCVIVTDPSSKPPPSFAEV